MYDHLQMHSQRHSSPASKVDAFIDQLGARCRRLADPRSRTVPHSEARHRVGMDGGMVMQYMLGAGVVIMV